MANCIDCRIKLGFLKRGRCEKCQAAYEAKVAAILDPLNRALDRAIGPDGDPIANWTELCQIDPAGLAIDAQKEMIGRALTEYLQRTPVSGCAWWSYPLATAVLLQLEPISPTTDLVASHREDLVIKCVSAGWPTLASQLLNTYSESEGRFDHEVTLVSTSATLERYYKRTENQIEMIGVGKDVHGAEILASKGRIHEVTVDEGFERIDSGALVLTNARLQFDGTSNRGSFASGTLRSTSSHRDGILRPQPNFWTDCRLVVRDADMLARLVCACGEFEAGSRAKVDYRAPLPVVPRMNAEIEDGLSGTAGDQATVEAYRFAAWLNQSTNAAVFDRTSAAGKAQIAQLVAYASSARPGRPATNPPSSRRQRSKAPSTVTTSEKGNSTSSTSTSSRSIELSPAESSPADSGGAETPTDARPSEERPRHGPIDVTISNYGQLIPLEQAEGRWLLTVLFDGKNVSPEPVDFILLRFSVHDSSGARFKQGDLGLYEKVGLRMPPNPSVQPRLNDHSFRIFELPRDAEIEQLSVEYGFSSEPSFLPLVVSASSITPEQQVFQEAEDEGVLQERRDPAQAIAEAVKAKIRRSLEAAGTPQPVSQASDEVDPTEDLLGSEDETEMGVGDLINSFGMKRLTPQARDRLSERLQEQDLWCDPAPSELDRYGSVRVFRAGRASGAEPETLDERSSLQASSAVEESGSKGPSVLLSGSDEAEIEVGVLLSHFGMKRLTDQARTRLAENLTESHMWCDPEPAEMDRYSSVRLFRQSNAKER